jgi:fido (protein-threonine AMPylation protein)
LSWGTHKSYARGLSSKTSEIASVQTHVIPCWVFIVVFLAIHPFKDGNGRLLCIPHNTVLLDQPNTPVA